MFKMSASKAATLLSNHISASVVRRLPKVARKEAVLAVMRGTNPHGVAESMKEAVASF